MIDEQVQGVQRSHEETDPASLERVARRRLMRGMAYSAAALLLPAGRAAAQTGTRAPVPSCTVRPQQTEGPFFIDRVPLRSDIRADPATGRISPGTVLDLEFRVSRLRPGACTVFPGVAVDVWQCDADGVYSAVTDHRSDSRDRGFLRGRQITDDLGSARFVTIYPGWYPGRAVHVHFKLRGAGSAAPGTATTSWEFTSQLYFDDALTDTIHAGGPYAARRGERVRNARDGLYARGGSRLVVPVGQREGRLSGRFDIALDV